VRRLHILDSPIAREALAQGEAERHTERRSLLEQIQAAERAGATAAGAVAAAISRLRAAVVAADRALTSARVDLHIEECDLLAIQSGHDARLGVLRRQLAPLGTDRLDECRRVLLIARRVAQNLDESRPVQTPLPAGGVAHSTQLVDYGGADGLRQIDEVLREVDAMRADANLSPAAIEARSAEIAAEVEGQPQPLRASAAERVTPLNLDKSRLGTQIIRIPPRAPCATLSARWPPLTRRQGATARC
jgi:hypothetical protein